MLNPNNTVEFFASLTSSLSNNIFISLSFSNYHGTEEGLKKILVKKLLIKREEKLSLTYRYKTRDIVKNYSLKDGNVVLESLLKWDGFRYATLHTLDNDLVLEFRSENRLFLQKKKAEKITLPSTQHNIEKPRHILPQGKGYLYSLGITDENGNVKNKAQDKYRQINHYIELLSSLLKSLPGHDLLQVTDMGSGKGYLTFALFDYLHNTLKLNVQLTGVELRQELVAFGNEVATQSGFASLRFIQGSIVEYDATGANILLALHACDTATDDAIYKGISARAELIVVAPCCHKQIRREMENNKRDNELDFLLKHGIFLERQAEMVTDGIRALIMEYFGYSTKIFEFISDKHTPKNVLITGLKNPNLPLYNPDILTRIDRIKDFFGIKAHYLESLAKPESYLMKTV